MYYESVMGELEKDEPVIGKTKVADFLICAWSRPNYAAGPVAEAAASAEGFVGHQSEFIPFAALARGAEGLCNS